MSKPAQNLSASVQDAFSGMSLCVVCWDIISAVDSATARMSVHSVPAGAWKLTRTLLLLFDGMYTKEELALVDLRMFSLLDMTYPLFNAYLPLYLPAQGAAFSSSIVSETYCNLTIGISILWIPGSLIVCAVAHRGTETCVGRVDHDD